LECRWKENTAKRMFLVDAFVFAWKKKDEFTLIEYIDRLIKKTLVFDFGKKMQEAQRKFYDLILVFPFVR
jgi:hypothetical protein